MQVICYCLLKISALKVLINELKQTCHTIEDGYTYLCNMKSFQIILNTAEVSKGGLKSCRYFTSFAIGLYFILFNNNV